MKLSERVLHNFSSEDFCKYKAILVYGNDHGLISSTISRLKFNFFNTYLDLELVDSCCISVESQTIGDISYALGTTPIMSDRCFIVMCGFEKLDSNQLESALNATRHIKTCVILKSIETTIPLKLKTLFETSANLGVISCFNMDRTSAIRLLDTFLKQQKNNISAELMQTVKENIPDTYLGVMQYVEKINMLFSSCTNPTQEDLAAICTDTAQTSLDAFINLIGNCRPDEAYLELDKLLLQNKKEQMLLIRSLQNYFAKILQARLGVDTGTNIEQAVQDIKPKVFWKNVPAFKNAILSFSVTDISKILYKLSKIEIQHKKHSIDLPHLLHMPMH